MTARTDSAPENVAQGRGHRTFTAEEFYRAMRSANLVGAFAFWRGLERLAQPDDCVRMHARGRLRELAEQQFNDYGGVAVSRQHAEALRYCGLEPIRTAAPGELGW